MYPQYDHDKIPTKLTFSGENHRVFALAAFEGWVASHLPAWLADCIAETTTPGTISKTMEVYYDHASSAYSEAPEMFSVMLLTIMELWVACDRSACTNHGMLKDYRPEIPTELLQCLVLPYKSQMRRLHAIEQYLRQRDRAAKQPSAVTSTFGSAVSFAVRFFDSSVEHQALKLRIEEHAHVARQQNGAEFRREKAHYNQLMQAYDSGTCDEDDVLVDSMNEFYAIASPQAFEQLKNACTLVRSETKIDVPKKTDTAAQTINALNTIDTAAKVHSLVPDSISFDSSNIEWRRRNIMSCKSHNATQRSLSCLESRGCVDMKTLHRSPLPI